MSDDFLRPLLDALPMALLVLEQTADGGSSGLPTGQPPHAMGWRIRYANAAAARLAGARLDEAIGRELPELLPAFDPELYRACTAACQTGSAQELSPNGHDGMTDALWLRALPLGGGLAALLGEQSEAARRANQFLDSIIEHLPAMIFMKDAEELRFERFNKAGEEMIGVSRTDLMGKSDYDFFPAEQANFFVQKDREVLARGTLEDIPEEPIQTPQGTRWLHTRKIPVLDSTGRARHLLGVSIDVTEQKRARDALRDYSIALERDVVMRTTELANTEEQLRQAQKMEAIGRLAGGIAHDFNNMLSVILSYTSIALQELKATDPLSADLNEIRLAAERATQLTRQLLAFSRRQLLEPRVVDLNDIIFRMDRMLRSLIGEDIELRTVPARDLGRARVDPHQIEHVIMNLVVNARDAMPNGGTLTIETSNFDCDERYADQHVGVAPGSYVMLTVTDTGVGMDRETMARVFEPFYTTKGVGKGTGLGLSTAFGIVAQSGGSIWVYSEPGQGASFKVYLPRTEAVETSHESKPAPRDSRGTETILLVEDEAQLRKVIAGVLRRNGYHVLEAANPGEALLFAQDASRTIQLLITDVVMPMQSGPELARQVQRTRPDLKVLCMSGYTDETVVQHGIAESGMAFLQKPMTPDVLLRKIREVLAS